jgi:hypothetical protein
MFTETHKTKPHLLAGYVGHKVSAEFCLLYSWQIYIKQSPTR